MGKKATLRADTQFDEVDETLPSDIEFDEVEAEVTTPTSEAKKKYTYYNSEDGIYTINIPIPFFRKAKNFFSSIGIRSPFFRK